MQKALEDRKVAAEEEKRRDREAMEVALQRNTDHVRQTEALMSLEGISISMMGKFLTQVKVSNVRLEKKVLDSRSEDESIRDVKMREASERMAKAHKKMLAAKEKQAAASPGRGG